jgi:hypothetical protein
MQANDRVLVGFDTSGETDVAAAVLHLRIERQGPNRLIAHVEVSAVAMSHRSPDPPYLGDEIMAKALAEARAAMTRYSCDSGMLAGYIHTDNNASMRMAARNDWEPLEAPGPESTFPGVAPFTNASTRFLLGSLPMQRSLTPSGLAGPLIPTTAILVAPPAVAGVAWPDSSRCLVTISGVDRGTHRHQQRPDRAHRYAQSKAP